MAFISKSVRVYINFLHLFSYQILVNLGVSSMKSLEGNHWKPIGKPMGNGSTLPSSSMPCRNEVLIHSAAGGVGLAAVHLCKKVGDDLFGWGKNLVEVFFFSLK